MILPPQSLLNWRIPAENLEASWDVNGVKHPGWSRFNRNTDTRSIVLEAQTRSLRDRTVDSTQSKQELRTQTAEQALIPPTNADMLSDLELFESETFFMSRRRPQLGPSNLGNALAGRSDVQSAELGMKHETMDDDVEPALAPRRRRGASIPDPTKFAIFLKASIDFAVREKELYRAAGEAEGGGVLKIAMVSVSWRTTPHIELRGGKYQLQIIETNKQATHEHQTLANAT